MVIISTLFCLNKYKKMAALSEKITNIYKKLSHAAMKAGRDPATVNLIAVTKKKDADIVLQAIDLGLRAFGESYVQEAKDKINDLSTKIANENLSWHLIGHLQKNKVKTAVELFDLIQTVDSIELAHLINKEAQKKGKVQKVLIQIKLSDEETKYGVLKKDAYDLVKEACKLENLSVEGLMTIPPYFENPIETIPYFRKLSNLKDELNEQGLCLKELSMGMSSDFEAAIQEGATMIRIGSAIFGER
ncbi:alanine racemase [Candidatus Magnetoovum chiemensis]|nr:alanine racemase [Candidatus Magnetoovum chiemensis]